MIPRALRTMLRRDQAIVLCGLVCVTVIAWRYLVTGVGMATSQSTRTTFATGIHVGLRCLGCCWALMGLMFVVGLMDVVWAAALALLVLVEKTLPQYRGVSRLTGAALISWGFFTLAMAGNALNR